MSKKILLVEDEADIRSIIEYILEERGYEVDSAATAAGFYERLNDHRPDLIILDIKLPDGDGRNLCKDVRAKGETSNVPVIMMSAHLRESEALEDVPANDFIPKPFDLDNFIERVQRQVTG
jgi:DNA-binding response OmpR family regulator